LPLVCKALDQAHTWIFEHVQQERESSHGSPDPEGHTVAR
jgi:hypothetical protein